jgi:Na+-translocating ferredoxin:NAD+ oxidoreductase RnfD subunit
MCAMIGVMKTIQLSSAILLGAMLGPIFYFISPEWSVLIGGVVAGTAAYLIGEKYGN